MEDFLFRGSLEMVDPEVFELTEIEAERQYRRLILIPSESTSPLAVRQALATAFHNIYAEGYPPQDTRELTAGEILDYPNRLAEYRRYGDPRYYKGVEYANLAEALARRRCTEVFASNGFKPEELYVNVQPLSGAPANNAVYHALVQPGDTIMGMDLLHGGHLSHGSSVHRSGKFYNAVHYTVSEEDERIDYDALGKLALQHRPKIIIAGYSSYPWSVDWHKFRAVADSVGAYLLADIAHVAGLVATGAYPSPVGIADVITFTTHKSLCGPRGACILTTDRLLARKIDRAVFPGEQGGPHVNVFAALAVAFKLAQTEQFRKLQHQVVSNCVALTDRLAERGFRIPYGGTNTHLTNLDCGSVKGNSGAPLSGDIAARILDLVGVEVNRNTIPGDRSARNPSGIRLGTPWVTQRGLREQEMVQIADIIADVLTAAQPYALPNGGQLRAKLDFETLEQAKVQVHALANGAGADLDLARHGYPHFYDLQDSVESKDGQAVLELRGERVRQFLNFAVSSEADSLEAKQAQPTRLSLPDRTIDGMLSCLDAHHFLLHLPADEAGRAAAWLRGLSDGFVAFDADLERKIPGPVVVEACRPASQPAQASASAPEAVSASKPYFIGVEENGGAPLPAFEWQEPEDPPLKRTPVFDLHEVLGARLIPFAGWEMPVWYSSVLEEHTAVRQAAGLFDVAHMGVYQAEGPDAAPFLDSVCGNDITALKVGQSLYTHFLDPHASVIDDLLVYRRDSDRYLVVVNASNDDKDWAWLNAVLRGEVQVDLERPGARAFGKQVRLRNLRHTDEGADQRVDIALQGRASREILLALGCDRDTRARIMGLKRTELCEGEVGGFDLVISRTGYTGERMAFELFVHPERSAELFKALLEAGGPLGLKPCGLGARDSLRTEAGLPLYGQEMGGDLNLGVAEAGFGSYVKTYKPWFIGRQAFLDREAGRRSQVVRFRFDEKGMRMAHLHDPVLDRRGRTIGVVTSCAVDSQGTLTGQAFLDLKYAEEGTPIYIYQSADRARMSDPGDLKPGDRITLPGAATVVRRFPRL